MFVFFCLCLLLITSFSTMVFFPLFKILGNVDGPVGLQFWSMTTRNIDLIGNMHPMQTPNLILIVGHDPHKEGFTTIDTHHPKDWRSPFHTPLLQHTKLVAMVLGHYRNWVILGPLLLCFEYIHHHGSIGHCCPQLQLSSINDYSEHDPTSVNAPSPTI